MADLIERTVEDAKYVRAPDAQELGDPGQLVRVEKGDEDHRQISRGVAGFGEAGRLVGLIGGFGHISLPGWDTAGMIRGRLCYISKRAYGHVTD